MAVATVADLKRIIGDIEALIESKLSETEFEHVLKDKEFGKVIDYVRENRTIPEDIHKEGSSNKDELLFGNLLDKLEQAEKVANRRAQMAGRGTVKDPRIDQAKKMRAVILGLKDGIIKEEIENEEFDFEDYQSMKEQETKDIQNEIDDNKKKIQYLYDIRKPLEGDKDIKEFLKIDNMQKSVKNYETLRRDLEDENKKPEDKKDKAKIAKLNADLELAKAAISATGLNDKFKTVKVNGNDMSIADALKGNKSISELEAKMGSELTQLRTVIDSKDVAIFTGLTATQKQEIAKYIGKNSPFTLEDADITTENLVKLLNSTTLAMNKLTRENKIKVKERDAKQSTIDDVKKMAILKDAEKLDRKTLYDNYAGKAEKDMISVLDTRKGRIDFWKNEINGPFKWIRARFKARKGNIAETKAKARGSILDDMIRKAKASKESYTKTFRDSLRIGIKTQNKNRVDDLDKKDVYKGMENLKAEADKGREIGD
jgi:hypothetical protein